MSNETDRRSPKLHFMSPVSSAPDTCYSLLDFETCLNKPPFKSSLFTVNPGATSKKDVHSVVEAWFVASGEGCLTYDSQEFPLYALDVVVFEPGKEHWVRVEEGAVPLVIFSVWWNVG